MKSVFVPFALIVSTLLPACSTLKPPAHAERSALPALLEQETVALVNWMGPTYDDDGKVVRDEEGHLVLTEVDPETNPIAELAPYCAGVWINNDTFVTAEHCVDDIGKPQLNRIMDAMFGSRGDWDPTGQPVLYSNKDDVDESKERRLRGTHGGYVLAIDRNHDLALVRATPGQLVPIPDHPCAKVATSFTVGEDAHVVGHTIGMWWTYSRGYVSSERKNMHITSELHNDVLQISAPVWFGNSGGGAFNSEGELLGIASFIKKAPDMGFFVDYELIARFIDDNGVKR